MLTLQLADEKIVKIDSKKAAKVSEFFRTILEDPASAAETIECKGVDSTIFNKFIVPVIEGTSYVRALCVEQNKSILHTGFKALHYFGMIPKATPPRSKPGLIYDRMTLQFDYLAEYKRLYDLDEFETTIISRVPGALPISIIIGEKFMLPKMLRLVYRVNNEDHVNDIILYKDDPEKLIRVLLDPIMKDIDIVGEINCTFKINSNLYNALLNYKTDFSKPPSKESLEKASKLTAIKVPWLFELYSEKLLACVIDQHDIKKEFFDTKKEQTEIVTLKAETKERKHIHFISNVSINWSDHNYSQTFNIGFTYQSRDYTVAVHISPFEFPFEFPDWQNDIYRHDKIVNPFDKTIKCDTLKQKINFIEELIYNGFELILK